MNEDGTINFTFEHVVFLSKRDLWKLLSEIDNVTLLQACQKVDPAVLFHIHSVFSKTARDCFNNDLNKFMLTSEKEIKVARKRIVVIFHRLCRYGRIKDWSLRYAA